MPCDYSKYPDNWFTDIRPAVLFRAKHCCEWCGVKNYSVGYRDSKGKFHPVCEPQTGYSEARQCSIDLQLDDAPKNIVIVLTIAHYHDPDPMNCGLDNLKALCQRCHNHLDAPMRQRNAAETRQRKRDELTGQTDLFGDAA